MKLLMHGKSYHTDTHSNDSNYGEHIDLSYYLIRESHAHVSALFVCQRLWGGWINPKISILLILCHFEDQS